MTTMTNYQLSLRLQKKRFWQKINRNAPWIITTTALTGWMLYAVAYIATKAS